MAVATKSTVVSIIPAELKISKPGLFPGNWTIPKADDDNPQLLHLGDSWHSIYLGVERGSLKVTDLSYDVARAIVEDLKRSYICVEPGCEPGIFWVPKVVDRDKVEMSCYEELRIARELQLNWYRKLIMMADDDWTKSGHMHRAVSDLQRAIAAKLHLDKEWIYVPKDDPSLFKCAACRSVIEKDTIVCPHCRLILQPDKHKELEFAL